MNSEESSEVSESLHDLLAEDRTLSEFLDGLARLSSRYFSGEHEVSVGILLRRPKHHDVVASSTDDSGRLDELQIGGDGPAHAARSTGRPVVVSDVHGEERWPEYVAAARARGLGGVAAVPLELEGTPEAVMTFHSRQANAFDDATVREAQSYAELAAKTLTVALRVATQSEAARHRRLAMESRTPIDIAVGIIMAERECSQDEAFTMLQTLSSQRNVKLRELAEEIVTSVGHSAPVTLFDP